MQNEQDRIDELSKKLDVLLVKQHSFMREIHQLKREIQSLEVSSANQSVVAPSDEVEKETPTQQIEVPQPIPTTERKASAVRDKIQFPDRSNIEKFIGETLINKIGILLLVLGVAIGAKLSIDNNLISPLGRIILGYLTGAGLLGLGMRLKEKYHNYSAVLVSGAMAIMYFITYAAYSFYGLIPQSLTFGLMVVFTAFTTFAAIHYNLVVVAHIGLVGAYAVPFLLSNNSGNAAFLFGYMILVNSGILFIAFRKYWKSIYYSSMVLSWIIFLSWVFLSYKSNDFELGSGVSTVFFVMFYAMLLAYKLLAKQRFVWSDIVFVLFNAFVFYGVGYGLINSYEGGERFLGLFTLGNAIVHFIVSAIIYKNQQVDRGLFYLASGLVLLFVTLAIPVQLDGNWVVLLWAGEAALLFWIARTKQVGFYEKMSYPLMVLGFVGWVITASNSYVVGDVNGGLNSLVSIFNIHFLTGALVAITLLFITYVAYKTRESLSFAPKTLWGGLGRYLAPVLALGTIYLLFFNEITYYWNYAYAASYIDIGERDSFEYVQDHSLLSMGLIWKINYSLLFVSGLMLLNHYLIKHKILGGGSAILMGVLLFLFLPLGVEAISSLSDFYITQPLADYYTTDGWYVWLRYLFFGVVFWSLYITWRLLPTWDESPVLQNIAIVALHFIVLVLLSVELTHQVESNDWGQSNKLGLSILWGVYSLGLISWGIWKGNKYLRIMAFVLFGITLMKLFFYDIAHLDTIAKTIVLVALGGLLLVISFLYNKYKSKIFDEEE